jgi:uncharacterized phage-associated protein
MLYDAKAIANFFLHEAENHGASLTQMKLQKLVYFAHGWHLGITNDPLLNEQVQAWSFGPVIRSLYKEFSEFGADKITRRAFSVRQNPGQRLNSLDNWQAYIPSIDDEAEDHEFVERLLKRIWEVYGDYTAFQLSNMTHADGTPWDRLSKSFNGNIPKYATILDEWIREYFKTPGGSE